MKVLILDKEDWLKEENGPGCMYTGSIPKPFRVNGRGEASGAGYNNGFGYGSGEGYGKGRFGYGSGRGSGKG